MTTTMTPPGTADQVLDATADLLAQRGYAKDCEDIIDPATFRPRPDGPLSLEYAFMYALEPGMEDLDDDEYHQIRHVHDGCDDLSHPKVVVTGVAFRRWAEQHNAARSAPDYVEDTAAVVAELRAAAAAYRRSCEIRCELDQVGGRTGRLRIEVAVADFWITGTDGRSTEKIAVLVTHDTAHRLRDRLEAYLATGEDMEAGPPSPFSTPPSEETSAK